MNRDPAGVECAYQLRELRDAMNAVLTLVDRLERAGKADDDRNVVEGARLARLDAEALLGRFQSMRHGLAQRALFSATRKDGEG